MQPQKKTTDERSAEGTIVPERLTIAQVKELHQALLTLLSRNEALTLDLSQVSQVDSAGLQLLLAARRSPHVTLAGINDDLRAQIDRFGILDLLERRSVHPS